MIFSRVIYVQLNPDGINGLFWTYFECGIIGDAIETVRDGIRMFPADDSVLYHDLANAYHEKEWFNEARETANEGLKMFPDDQDLKDLLDLINQDDNDPDDDKKPPLKALLGFMLLKEALKKGKQC